MTKNTENKSASDTQVNSSYAISSMGFEYELPASAQPQSAWQLTTTAAGSANFAGAWLEGDASGVTVSVVDEGVNYRHVDLAGSYDAMLDYDPRDVGVSDAAPDTFAERHGTQVAGLITGDNSSMSGAVGGAQGATLTASYIRYGVHSNFAEIDDLIAAQQNFDVSNNSWGFTRAFADNFNTAQYAATAQALEDVVTNGRDGLGTVMIFAAGNGRLSTASGNIGDDVNFHNLTNSRYSIAVGAHGSSGAPAFFSNPGTSLMLTAPGVGLLTTDGALGVTGGATYVSGTSFAAPIVSSAVALMLAENPSLGYRDVQEILILSSRARAGGSSTENGGTHFNGGGLSFTREGGFGTLDASAAVSLARHWDKTSTAANENSVAAGFSLSSSSPAGTVLSASVNSGSAGELSTQWVTIDLKLTDSHLRDLRIELVSPDGTRAVIAENLAQIGSTTSLDFTFSSLVTWGEDSDGDWRLELTHPVGIGSDLLVQAATLTVYGDRVSADDTYFFSDSFSHLAASNGDRHAITDEDGGANTLNFAAASSGGLRLDLSGATDSSFHGSPLNVTGSFQTVIGSQSHDVISGTFAVERIVGDAGDDVLFGAGGNDTLIGGIGNDTLDGGADDDLLEGGSGNDALFGGDDNDAMFGRSGNDTMFGGRGQVDNMLAGDGSDVMFGDDGVDNMFGESGADSISGGAGNDGLFGGDGGDVMAGDAGDDAMNGDAGSDLMDGGEGSDQIVGGAGNDYLYGSAGDDGLYGGDDADRLDGGEGVDGLFGGMGDDLFVFNVGNGGLDVIFDGQFGAGAGDVIAIEGAPSGLQNFDALLANSYQTGSTAVLVFNNTTGIFLANTDLTTLAPDDFLFV